MWVSDVADIGATFGLTGLGHPCPVPALSVQSAAWAVLREQSRQICARSAETLTLLALRLRAAMPVLLFQGGPGKSP